MGKLLEGDTSLWLPLLSGSMIPSLKPGDELFIVPRPDSYKRGDIAVFLSGGKFFSHRVLLSLRLGRYHYLLEKGDANRSGSIISYEKAIGLVTEVRRDEETFFLRQGKEARRSKKAALVSLRRLIMYRLFK